LSVVYVVRKRGGWNSKKGSTESTGSEKSDGRQVGTIDI
jgi:hypothetical protein